VKRPLTVFCIALIIGIMSGEFFNSYIEIAIVSVVLLTVPPFLFKKYYNKNKDKNIILLVLLSSTFLIIGLTEIFYLNNLNEHKFIPFSNQYVTITGQINSEPDIRDNKILYEIKTNKIITQKEIKVVKGNILFTTLKTNKNIFYEYGSEISIRGKISIPKVATNPGGFNYSRYLSQKGISSTIFANEYDIIISGKNIGNILVQFGLKIRQKIILIINKSLPKEEAGLLTEC